MDVWFPDVAPWMLRVMADHPAICALIHARTSATRQAVMRCENLTGAGKVLFLTLRHSVGALKGSGTARHGRLGLCTRCASRMKALSGSVSNDGMVSAGLGACAGILAAIGFCFALLGCDMVRPHVNEGLISGSYAVIFTADWLAVTCGYSSVTASC